jgi:hypothetical protein
MSESFNIVAETQRDTPWRAWRGESNAPFAPARLGAVAVGNILVDTGYNTAWFGKRHGTR